MRRAILSAIPVLGLVMMLQISIASRIMLLSGNVDLLLLVLAAWGLQERVRSSMHREWKEHIRQKSES